MHNGVERFGSYAGQVEAVVERFVDESDDGSVKSARCVSVYRLCVD